MYSLVLFDRLVLAGPGNMTWLLLSQLRWMDTPVAEDSLTERLEELLSCLSGGLQVQSSHIHRN